LNLFYWVESGQLRTDDVVQHDLCRLISLGHPGSSSSESVFLVFSSALTTVLICRSAEAVRNGSHRPNLTLSESIGIRLVTNTAGTFVVPALSSLGRLEPLRYLPPPPPPPPPPLPLLGAGETKRPCKGFHRPGSKPAARLALSTMELTDGAAAAVVGIVLLRVAAVWFCW
jgi:hypothetical protein